MHEEQDTCRICSAPAESDQPLFHPCKCSGTIRYIHQECLTTWLAHSKKKTCDVCKHPYSFTKVYSEDMPKSLPLFLLLRQLAHQALLVLLFILRAILVATIWLAFLPWATIMTWRMYFTFGESAAWWISSYPRPDGSHPQQQHTLVPRNTSAPAHDHPDFPPTFNGTTSAFVHVLLTHPTIRDLSADILSGQIIASVIVLGFVAVFLLREWITQNARPGVFDDAEAPPEGDVIPPAAPADVPPAPALEPPPVPAPGLRPIPIPTPVFPEDLRAPPLPDLLGKNGEPDDVRHSERRKRSLDADRPGEKQATAKGKEVALPNRKAGTLKRRHSWGDPTSLPSGSGLALDPEQAQFTFQLAPPSTFPPNVGTPTSSLLPSASSDHDEPLTPPNASPSTFSPTRRPPLATSDLSFTPSPPNGTTNNPPTSPSVATYRPPEEFEAGPSGYFHSDIPSQDGLLDSDDTVPEDMDHYFREPEPGQGSGSAATFQEAIHVEQHFEEDDSDSPPAQPPSEVDDIEDEEDAGVPEHDDDDPPPDANDVPIGGGLPAQQDQQQPIRVDADPLEQEEMDAAMEDDMDGALEAIGLRGPLHAVLQNAGLMIFVLDITIACLVWLPFMVGKSLALLALNPRRSLYLLHLPLRAIRFITDPVVDFLLYLFARTVVPPFLRFGEGVASKTFNVLSRLVGQTMSKKIVELSSGVSHQGAQAIHAAWEYVFPQLAMTEEGVIPVEVPSIVERLAAQDSMLFQLAEPYFTPIGHAIRLHTAEAKDTWIRLAIGDGTSSRLFAITLGYAVDALLLALYLNVLTVGSVKNAGRAFRNAVRQQLLIVKVAGFIIIELIIFPLGCGVMLDICTVWLFPQGSFRSRAAYLMFAPLTSAFYHWVIGTMFMYQFAVLLAGCRSIMRAGAMWFIKDPQDQNFHPIRDILERPTFVQIRKLLLSAVMYGLVVLCGVATVSGLLRAFSRTIMPFRWQVRGALFEVPVDLIFLLFALPYTLHYFRPKKAIHKVGTALWKYFSRQLRLTSYMFGGRHPSEEYTPVKWSWRQLLIQPGVEMSDAEGKHDGSFRRVPNNDNVALVKNESATADVDEEGNPKTDRDLRLVQLQNAEAEKAKRNIRDDYTIVYIPPNFRYRIAGFIFCLWVVGSTVLSLALAVPILTGRAFLKPFFADDVHDGYSFLVGFYLFWGCWIINESVGRLDKRRQRRGGDEPRALFPLYVVKRSLLWVAQITYMIFFLGIVIPTLLAIVVELYIILPARLSISPDVEPRIRVVHMWAYGLLYLKIALRTPRLLGDGRLTRGIEHIRRTGWTYPDPFRATREVIVPMTSGLLGLVFAPPLILALARYFLVLDITDNFLFLHVYPTMFTVAGCAHAITALSSVFGTWSQSVRDKEFLVEMRLQNLEQDPAEEGENDDSLPILDDDQAGQEGFE